MSLLFAIFSEISDFLFMSQRVIKNKYPFKKAIEKRNPKPEKAENTKEL